MTHIVDIVVCLQLEHNTSQDQLIAVLGSDQAIMRKIQSRVVSRLVVLLGIRWSSSLHRGQVGPIVQNIVVQGALAGVSTDAKYRELKAASVKGDFHFLQQIQQTQNKTAKQHRDKIQEIITALFEDTTDPIQYVEKVYFFRFKFSFIKVKTISIISISRILLTYK